MTPPTRLPVQLLATAVLAASALAVRAIPDATHAPAISEVEASIARPEQLLGAAGKRRLPELDEWVSESRQGRFVALRREVTSLTGCPDLTTWLNGPEGLEFGRLVDELTRGTSEEALAALALEFQLAYRTTWKPGLFGGSAAAERLGDRLGRWLDAHAAAAVGDPLLHYPALAACVLYGAVMDAAFQGGFFDQSDPSRTRAERRLSELLGERGRFTELGAALLNRYPGVFEVSRPTAGLAAELRLWFPALARGCDD